MRLPICATLALVSLAGFPRAAKAQPAQPAKAARAGVIGCYAFFDRAARPAAESLYWAPATARLESGGRAVRLTPEFDPGRSSGPGAYRWSVRGPGDSLRVSFHNGYSGTEFVLGQAGRGDTLRGRAREHWDFGPPYETEAGPASAVRIACPDSSKAQPRRPDA